MCYDCLKPGYYGNLVVRKMWIGKCEICREKCIGEIAIMRTGMIECHVLCGECLVKLYGCEKCGDILELSVNGISMCRRCVGYD
jgi:hypothetical protein